MQLEKEPHEVPEGFQVPPDYTLRTTAVNYSASQLETLYWINARADNSFHGQHILNKFQKWVVVVKETWIILLIRF